MIWVDADQSSDSDLFSMGEESTWVAIGTAAGAVVAGWKAFKSWHDKNLSSGTLEPTMPEPQPPDTARVLRMNALLQECAQDLGGSSAVLMLWEPTERGGIVSILAEWPGVLPPSAPHYQRVELGRDYVRDVIEDLRRDGWKVIDVEKLTHQSPLADLFEARHTVISWVHVVLDDPGEAIIYTSLHFNDKPAHASAEIRDTMRTLGLNICEALT